MRRSVFSAVCAAVAALLFFFPSLFSLRTQNRVIQKWLYGSRLAYEGEITVWTVDTNADGKGSLSGWLDGRSAFFKERNFGVYPVLDPPMTVEEVQQRMAAGETPDVILCGSDVPPCVLERAIGYEGPFPMPLVLPQEADGLLTPVLRSGVLILVNEDALYLAGTNPPPDLAGMDGEWLDSLLELCPDAFGYDDGTSLMAVMTNEVPPAAQQALLRASPCDMQAFLNGDVAIYAASQRALWELYRQELMGKPLPGVSIHPLCSFVPNVEYAVLMQNEDAQRQEAARAFITVLVGKSAQTALGDIYALPVVEGTTCARSDLYVLWQCAPQAQYIYGGSGKEAFMEKVHAGTDILELREFVMGLCHLIE